MAQAQTSSKRPVRRGSPRAPSFVQRIATEKAKMDFLSHVWNEICLEIDPSSDKARSVLKMIKDQYEQGHRHYHTLAHIHECFAVLAVLRTVDFGGRNLISDLDFKDLAMALLFHDAVYDTWKHDNEERSADFAVYCMEDILELPHLYAERVRELILAAKHVGPFRTYTAQVMVDIDLYSLALPWDQFWQDTQNIRQEYFWVHPVSAFAQSRASILEGFLGRSPIYQTDLFREQFEQKAQRNLRRAVKLLYSSEHGLV